jgi:hypothetical protein
VSTYSTSSSILLSHVSQLPMSVERCHVVVFYFAIAHATDIETRRTMAKDSSLLLSSFHPIDNPSSLPASDALIQLLSCVLNFSYNGSRHDATRAATRSAR